MVPCCSEEDEELLSTVAAGEQPAQTPSLCEDRVSRLSQSAVPVTTAALGSEVFTAALAP